jgi:hypothetical protein
LGVGRERPRWSPFRGFSAGGYRPFPAAAGESEHGETSEVARGGEQLEIG